MTTDLRLVCLLSGSILWSVAGCTNDSKPNRKSEKPATPVVDTSATEPGLADLDAPVEFTLSQTGLKYRILRRSDKKKPNIASTVTVHYRGWLSDGTLFDSTYSRGEALTSRVDELLAGWREGLQVLGEGGMIELEVPPDLAYGNIGMPPAIPGDATLHFVIELVIVK